MNSNLKRLVVALQSGRMLGEALVEPSEIPTALDGRDTFEFEEPWRRIYDVIKRAADLDEATEAVLKRIRELAFKAAYRFSSDPEFSGYVSDDFDLIGRSMATATEDHWLSGVLAEYSLGRFPRGRVTPVQKKLGDLIPS